MPPFWPSIITRWPLLQSRPYNFTVTSRLVFPCRNQNPIYGAFLSCNARGRASENVQERELDDFQEDPKASNDTAEPVQSIPRRRKGRPRKADAIDSDPAASAPDAEPAQGLVKTKRVGRPKKVIEEATIERKPRGRPKTTAAASITKRTPSRLKEIQKKSGTTSIKEPNGPAKHAVDTVNNAPRARRGRPPSKKASALDRTLITPGSQKHYDLQSFLAYAKRVGLSETTNVYVGTHYEYTVVEALQRFGFALTRIGRSSDLGIDLVGHWTLPSVPGQMRTLVQCKAEKPRPSFVRELEGAYVGAPAGWRGDSVLALLAASKEATKGVRDAITRSKWPMGFLNVTADGTIKQFIWNQSAQDRGLEGMGVAVKHCRDEEGAEGDQLSQVATLTWDGSPWTAT